MFSKRIRSRGLSQRFAVAVAVALVVSPLVVEANPAAGSGSVVAEVVNVNFESATTSGTSVVNTGAQKIDDLTMVGAPTGINTSDGLVFSNTASRPLADRQYLTGKLGLTTNITKIEIEMVARFPDSGCAAQNTGSMVFSLGGSSFVSYNIYRHSNFIGFNTFQSDLYGIQIPNTTDFFNYKFVMVPNESSPGGQAITAQKIFISPIGQPLGEQALDFRTTDSLTQVPGCSTITGPDENNSARIFEANTPLGYKDGSFTLMTHALGASTWATTGSIRSVKITTHTLPAPTAPTISAITGSNAQLSVAFTAPSSDGGAAISNYQRSLNNASWIPRSPSSSASPLVIPSLNNGTNYSVYIRAVNANGARSPFALQTGTPRTTPGAPTISAITPENGKLSVDFSAPSSNGGALISNYEFSTDNGSSWTPRSPSSTATPIEIPGLTNGTSYTVSIRAVNSEGGGVASNAVSGTPIAPSSPTPPSSSSGPALPPTPPTTTVSAISIAPSDSSRSSKLTLKLNAPPTSSERITVVVRLLDLNGKLIQELTIPVSSTTSSLEVPVNLPIGTFTVSAGTSNSLASSQAMTLQADTVKKTWLASPSPEGTLRLAGKLASDPIYFSPNSVSLSKQARSELRQAAKVAKRTNSRVAVTGFSADSGMGTVFEKNIAERRALAVTKFLKAQGVSSWLFFSGFDGAKTAKFSGQPRRVEIRILK